MLCLVVDHSSREFSPNSMIAHENIAGIHLNGIHMLWTSILQHKATHHRVDLLLFKSDISAAYWQLPIHPVFQIIQFMTINGHWYGNRNNNFKGRASQIIWQLPIFLIIWILVFKQGLQALKCSMNDTLLIGWVGDISWYVPYTKGMPTGQVRVLKLVDEIHLPHVEEQISGAVILILGFEVGLNRMMVYLSSEKHQWLIECVGECMHRTSKPLHKWLWLAGQLNWAFNVYPWLRPALGAVYVKTAGKTQMWGRVKIKKAVQCKLRWFIEHIKRLDRNSFFNSMVWHGDNCGHSTQTIHVNSSGQGIGIWFQSEKGGYQCWLLSGVPMGAIIMTNNMNMFNIFMLLSALPVYNPILMSAINIFLEKKMDIHTIYISSWMPCPHSTMNLQPERCLVFPFSPFNPLRMHWGQPKNDRCLCTFQAAHYHHPALSMNGFFFLNHHPLLWLSASPFIDDWQWHIAMYLISDHHSFYPAH